MLLWGQQKSIKIDSKASSSRHFWKLTLALVVIRGSPDGKAAVGLS